MLGQFVAISSCLCIALLHHRVTGRLFLAILVREQPGSVFASPDYGCLVQIVVAAALDTTQLRVEVVEAKVLVEICELP